MQKGPSLTSPTPVLLLSIPYRPGNDQVTADLRMKDITIVHFWVSNVGHLLLVINLALCLIRRRQLPSYFRWFTLFLATGLLIQILAKVIWYMILNNLPLLHVYTLLEFVLLSLFYRALLQELKFRYWTHLIVIGAMLIMLNSIFLQPLTSFNSIAKTFTQLMYIGYALTYFFGPFKREHALTNQINSAILVYYSGSLFIFMFTSVLTGLQDLIPYYRYLWITNSILYFLFHLMILTGLWKAVSQQPKSLL